MTVSARTLELLMAAGVQGADLLAIVRSIEEDGPVGGPSPVAREGARRRTRRYRERGGDQIPPDLREAVFQRDNFQCVECDSPDDLTCDHVVPVIRGGETTLANLDTLCRPCNARKRDRERKRAEYSERARKLRGDSVETPPPDGPPFPRTPNPPLNPPADVPSAENPRARKGTPRAELMAVLDAKRADAVIEHRQRIRKPITAHGAALLAGKLRQAPDPNAAADMMIERGWQGFEPEWVARDRGRGQGPPAHGGLTGMGRIIAEEAGLFDGTGGHDDE